jgi:DNA mismatch repair protein MutS
VPLAGVPVKAAGDYVRRLVQQGFRVAICEQVEDPKDGERRRQREVVETVTPGVAFADDLLDGARNNFICALSVATGKRDGGEWHRRPWALLLPTCRRVKCVSSSRRCPRSIRCSRALSPRELLVATGSSVPLPPSRSDALITERDAWEFDEPLAREDLARQYGVLSLDGMGVAADDGPAISAAGALLRYLRELQPSGLPQLARPIVEASGRCDAAR